MSRTPTAAVIHTHAHDVHVPDPLNTLVLVGGFIPTAQYVPLGIPNSAPVPGSIWRHWRNRDSYTVLGIVPSHQQAGQAAADFAVVYLGASCGRVWIRRLTGEGGWLTPPDNVPADLTSEPRRFYHVSLWAKPSSTLPSMPPADMRPPMNPSLVPPRKRPEESVREYDDRLKGWVQAVAREAMRRAVRIQRVDIIAQAEIGVARANTTAMQEWRDRRGEKKSE